MFHMGLSLPCSSLSVTLRSGTDRRLRPYPCGLILSTGALPILNLMLSWCRRCARSCTAQVPSEQPCLLDWLAEFLDLLVRTLMSVLEDKRKRQQNITHALHSWVTHTWVFIYFFYILNCFDKQKTFVDLQELMASVLPGMWQQSIPDILRPDKMLWLFSLFYWYTVKITSQSAPHPHT